MGIFSRVGDVVDDSIFIGDWLYFYQRYKYVSDRFNVEVNLYWRWIFDTTMNNWFRFMLKGIFFLMFYYIEKDGVNDDDEIELIAMFVGEREQARNIHKL